MTSFPFWRLAAIALVVLLATGCASFDTREFNNAESNIKSVELLTVAQPEKLAARTIASMGANFGLIGALASEAAMASRAKALNAAVATEEYVAQDDLLAQLKSHLVEAGYTVTQREIDRNKKPAFLKDYPDNVNNVDAYLDVYVSYLGYAAIGTGKPYKPTVHLNCRMVDARSGEIHFADQVFFNPAGQTGALTIDVDDEFSYAKLDELKTEPAKAVAGLKHANQQVAKRLGDELRLP